MVLATLTIRSALRSSSCATRTVPATNRTSPTSEASVAEECEALVLDRVAHGVDGVVVVDDPLCADEVAASKASVPAAIAFVVSDASRTTSERQSRGVERATVRVHHFIIDAAA